MIRKSGVHNFDFGYTVRYKNREGIVTKAWKDGTIGVSFPRQGRDLRLGVYDLRVNPSELEVISRQTPPGFVPDRSPDNMSVFDLARVDVAMKNPDEILKAEGDYPSYIVSLARYIARV